MPTPDSDAQGWELNTPNLPDVRRARVYDRVSSEAGYPQHLGLGFAVEVTAPDIDAAIAEVKRHGEMLAAFMSVAARAGVSPLYVQLAYEITPGVIERDFVRVAWGAPMPEGKRPAQVDLFAAISGFFLDNPTPQARIADRVTLSMSRYRLSLDESDVLARFLHLWIAVAAISPLVARHYDFENDQGWRGLRRLAEDEGLPADLVSRMLDVRRHIHHAFERTSDDLRADLLESIGDLERLLFAAYRRAVPTFADEASEDESLVDADTYVVLRATVMEDEGNPWSIDHHPDVDLETAVEPAPEQEPGHLTLTVRHNVAAQNVKTISPLSFEIRRG